MHFIRKIPPDFRQLLLPPHGLLLMTMRGVAPPPLTMAHIFKAVVFYLVMSLLLLVLLLLFPCIAAWLSNRMFGYNSV